MSDPKRRTAILAGGEMHAAPHISEGDYVIAADSGYDHAVAHSIHVDLLIGDLDSISDEGLRHAHTHGVEIEEHDPDKDETDLDLAVKAAVRHGATVIDIYGAEAGRLDHLLGVALLLSSSTWAPLDITWQTRSGALKAATPQRSVVFSTSHGTSITLLPIGDASGVTTTGLRWQLDNATLQRGTSLGISNTATGESVTVHVQDGALLVFMEGQNNT